MPTQRSSISLHRLEPLLVPFRFRQPPISKPALSFRTLVDVNEKYVKPNFSSEDDGIKKGVLPKIILIAAAGAVGKSELTRYLSALHGMPIFDLAAHTPVGSDSLTGLFFQTMGTKGLASYIDSLQTGDASMIIDGLDEGLLRTKDAAFMSFLDGVVTIAKDAARTPFVLLGRTNAVERCALYLWDQDISAEILNIEPFTEEQAKDFIDKQLGGEIGYNAQYRQVRDHIIKSIHGFLQNESDIAKPQSHNFIGYAPVLMAIFVLLREERNYKALYQKLTTKNDEGLDLILDIARRIMKRDREEKILPAIKYGILEGRSIEFRNDVEGRVYSEDEQCVRILHHLLGKTPDIRISEDPTFNVEYETMAKQWLTEHPFIQGTVFQNAVFECFVLAKLMVMKEHRALVLEYLAKHKTAHMLFSFFDKLSPNRMIVPEYLPHLFGALKSLDNQHNFFGVSVTANGNEEDEEFDCDVEFFNEHDPAEKYEFTMPMDALASLELNGPVSNFELAAPIDVKFKGVRIELDSPVIINCKTVSIDIDDIVVSKGHEGDVLLECDEVKIDYTGGKIPQIISRAGSKNSLIVMCRVKPGHPFADYYQDDTSVLKALDPGLMEKYLRLRTIMMQFRSHSKGQLAKLQDKIEHQRVYKNDVGWGVLEKLKETGVL
jgi:hypothetical protein